MKRLISIFISLVFFVSCSKEEDSSVDILSDQSLEIRAVDISGFPEVNLSNPSFFDLNGVEKNFLSILKENGINTIRLRLWVDPKNEHSSFQEVKSFSAQLKQQGFKTWLTLHYSDTWADPGQQVIPLRWQGIGITALKDSVYYYTQTVVNELRPDYIQVGNEINTGLLHPLGDLINEPDNCNQLLEAGISAIRENSSTAKIILHYAGIDRSDWFFEQMSGLDYDCIGLSYYPIWHGKFLDSLGIVMKQLSEKHNKPIVIAETAYPFTLEWNDWTHNIVGESDQLILPTYPSSPEGQRKFIHHISAVVKTIDRGMGFCYWGAEQIAWKGEQATDASAWENQALFDFNHRALPVLLEFRE